MKLHFDGTAIHVDTCTRIMNFRSSYASVSDADGALEFYTNGVFIANAEDDTMANGSGINPSDYTSESGSQLYGLGITNNIAIVRDLSDKRVCHLFHLSPDYLNFGSSYHATKFYHSVVDMSLDGGKGAVTLKNEVLVADTLNSQASAIRHANGRDWWVLVRIPFREAFYRFLLTPDGLSPPHYIELPAQSQSAEGFNQIAVSPDGSMLAGYNPYYGVWLYHFDRCRGDILSLDILPIPETITGVLGGGVSFSPNSRYLYVSCTYELYQYNLSVADIPSSRVNVGVYDGFVDSSPVAFHWLYLSPNNKIYVICVSAVKYFGTIHNPDLPGLSCNFIQHDFQLPARNKGTVPNYTNYRLGALAGSGCDTLQQVGVPAASGAEPIKIYPNPTHDKLHIANAPPHCEAVMYDILGRERLRVAVANNEIEVGSLAEGVYMLRLESAGKTVALRKIIIQR